MESLKNFYVKLTNQNYVRDGENVIGVTCTDKMLDELELIVASVQEELETLRAENAKLIAERDMLQNNIEGDAAHIKSLEEAFDKIEKYNWQLLAERDMLKLCADQNEDEVKKMIAERDEMHKKLEAQDDHCKTLSGHIDDLNAELHEAAFAASALWAKIDEYQAERKEYLANKILDASDKKLLDRLLAERDQYENHDVYATLYEDAKALIDPHTKASGGELPTSVIQSFEYLFKFWIEHKTERMKQEPLGFIDAYAVGMLKTGHQAHIFPSGEVPVFIRPLPAQQIPEEYAIEILRKVFDLYESGTDCYDSEDHYSAAYLGKCIRLDDNLFKSCVDLLSESQPKGDE